MSKRGNGEGSIYYRKRDGKWVGALVVDGRRRVVYGNTQGQARDELRRLQGSALPIAVGRAATLGEYLEQWITVTLPSRVRAGRLKPSTFDSYRDVVERHIMPSLGKEPLVKLTPAKVRAWISAKQVAPSSRQPKAPTDGPAPPPVLLSSRTVSYFHAVLRKALADAMRDELVGRNVAALVEPPVVRRAPVAPLTADEARTVLEAAAHDRLRVLWLVMLAIGLRRGEALALRWDDLDLDADTVTIARSLQRLRGAKNDATGRRKGELLEVAPKTEGSSATIALPASLVTALREHAEVQQLERMVARAWIDPGLVFTTSVGTALEPRNVNRAWSALCDRAGVRRVRLHDLRHSAATFMLSAGVDLKMIQTTLRHSRLATTADVYAHVLDEVQHQAAARMDVVLRALDPSV